MDISNSTDTYYWKIALFGPLNICIMFADKVLECLEIPYDWIYILFQDAAVCLELLRLCRGFNWRGLTFSGAWSRILNTEWPVSLFVFSFLGIHAIWTRNFFISKPEYCKEFAKRFGFK